MQCITPTTQPVPSQHSMTQSAPQNRHIDQSEPNTYQPRDKLVSISELSYLLHRQLKIKGEIDNHTSDITDRNVCRQMYEGIQEDFRDS